MLSLQTCNVRITITYCAWLCLFIYGGAWAQDRTAQPPLRLGLLPYLSSQKLIATFAPLADFLEERLQRKVVIVTAPDFAEYFKRVNLGHYDIYFTAPHFAAYAEEKFQHKRLVRPERNLRGAFVVPLVSKVKVIADLGGKLVATPDSLAVISILAERILQSHGLVPGRNVFIRYASSHNNAIATALEGRSDAAIALSAFYDNLDLAKKARLKILALTPPIPHAMFMANSDLQQTLYDAVLKALLAFPDSNEGRVFFVETAFIDFIEISDKDMVLMKEFIPHLEARVK